MKTILLIISMFLLVLNFLELRNILEGFKIYKFEYVIRLILDSIFLIYYIFRPNLGRNVEQIVLTIGLFFIVYFPLSLLKKEGDLPINTNILDNSYNLEKNMLKSIPVEKIFVKFISSSIYCLFLYNILFY